jgi:hypothetical protein
MDYFVALGCAGAYYIRSELSSCWSNLPRELQNKLKGRQKSLPDVAFIALSACNLDQYYVLFEDGKSQWNFCSSRFSECVTEHDSIPKFVAFGPDDTYFVKFEDGDWAYSLPNNLSSRLNGRQAHLPQIDKVAMNQDGDYWVQFEGGATWFDVQDDHLRYRMYEGNGCSQASLGESTYFVCCSECYDYDVTNDFKNAWKEMRNIEFENERSISPDEEIDESGDESSSEMEEEIVWVDPNEIKFINNSISQKFKDGSTIHDLLRQLRNGTTDVSEIPIIRVVDLDQDGLWSLDNRRLWAFKKASLESIPVKIVIGDLHFFDRVNEQLRYDRGDTVTVRQ